MDELTLRDYFAGLALSGTMAQDVKMDNVNQVAANMYTIADAMLAAREVERD